MQLNSMTIVGQFSVCGGEITRRMRTRLHNLRFRLGREVEVKEPLIAHSWSENSHRTAACLAANLGVKPEYWSVLDPVFEPDQNEFEAQIENILAKACLVGAQCSKRQKEGHLIVVVGPEMIKPLAVNSCKKAGLRWDWHDIEFDQGHTVSLVPGHKVVFFQDAKKLVLIPEAI
jgi:hypothetical protein